MEHVGTNTVNGRSIAVDARRLRRKDIGISRYLARSVSALMDAGANIILLVDDRSCCADLAVEYPTATVMNIPGRKGFIWEQYALYRHLRTARYDAFIAPANYGIPVGYRGQTRLLLIVHDLIPIKLPRQYLFVRPLWAIKYLLSTGIALMKANRIITVSHSSARDIVRLVGRRRIDIDVVYPEIPSPYTGDAGNGRAMACRFGSYFVYNGGADPRKNVGMLLRAVALLSERSPEMNLVILGTGYEYYRNMAQRIGVSDKVHFLGYVSDDEKQAIISGSVALIYPSSYEGFGLPVIEGMAAGVPVVTGTGGSLLEVGGDAAIYVRPLNEQQLASAMIHAATVEVRRDARSAGRDWLDVLAKRQQERTLVTVVGEVLHSLAISESEASSEI